MTFKIFAVLGALGIRATGFKRAQGPQGNQHCAKFESHTNRVTFETNTIMMIVKVHPILYIIVFLFLGVVAVLCMIFWVILCFSLSKKGG